MDKRPFTCCFTGHRNLPIGQEEEIWRRVYACLEPLLEEGVRYFGVGGALGFDTLVAEKLLELRESRPQIRIILVQPFPGYQSRWTPAQQARAAAVEARVDRWSSAAKRPAVRPFWPATGTWWTAPPAASPGVPAPPAAPPTPCAMRKSRACGCGTWPCPAKGTNCALPKVFGVPIMEGNKRGDGADDRSSSSLDLGQGQVHDLPAPGPQDPGPFVGVRGRQGGAGRDQAAGSHPGVPGGTGRHAGRGRRVHGSDP